MTETILVFFKHIKKIAAKIGIAVHEVARINPAKVETIFYWNNIFS